MTVDEVEVEKTVTIGEIAAKISVSLDILPQNAYRRVCRACESAQLPAVKIGRKDVRIKEKDAILWLKKYLRGVPYA